MLALPAPYGWDSPSCASITLSWQGGPLDREAAREALLQHSAYPPAIPKILDCLENGGRYDCYVMIGTAKELNRHSALAPLGIGCTINWIRGRWSGGPVGLHNIPRR